MPRFKLPRFSTVILLVIFPLLLGGGSGDRRRPAPITERAAPAGGANAAGRADITGNAAVMDLQIKQGIHAKLWLGTNGSIGEGAFENFMPPDRVGMEYPVGSNIEHLYGAGIWFGTVVDTGAGANARRIRTVTTGYNWGSGGVRREMYGHLTPRDTFFTTSVNRTGEPNRRAWDDDGDGATDEDELDGYDNDGDWERALHDLGGDGLPDSLETGCGGAFDAALNPDPAHDNYDPGKRDVCRPDQSGNFPRQGDPYFYTQGNGQPDRGEHGVDEDYAAVSENDIYVGYRDLYTEPLVPGHVPLGIRVWQRSYAWRDLVQYPILPIEYKIVNAGTRTLDSIYLGFFLDPLIGHIDKSNILTQKHSAYMPDLRTAYANNVYERPVTPVGVVLLGVPRPLSSLRYTFAWTSFDDNPATDEELYSLMSSGTIKPNEPTTPGSDSQSLLAFGPFDSMEPGDTLVMIAAIISGDGVDIGPRSLKANAERALALYHAGFKLPPVPASPPLRITEGHQSVTLDWRWREGDGAKPEELWDDSNKYLVTLPPDHWRRVNPPAGSNTGGRIFEGYRLYRGESPEFDPSTFTLLRQYDVADDLGFEYDEGVEYSFTDENLVRGKRYWYSVTSFAIPTMSINEIRLQDGTYSFDTLITPGVESDFSSNATVVQPGFTPATEAGTVLVVPNPYRLDENYTFEAGGWEGRGRDWSEYKRTIWFTHLPPVAKIRVYSLTGDIVTELDHDDGAREAAGLPAGQEEWDLLSGSGRAIASGLYVFSVHSEFGTQIGKFVIIR